MSAEEIAQPVVPAAEAEIDDPFLSLKRGGTEVYLIRHADALPGADEVVGGGYDEQALSALGRRQGQALGERMREVPLAAVYSSPIGRAVQTARYVAEPQGLEVRIEPGVREVMLGPIGVNGDEQTSPEEVAELLRRRLREIAAIAVTSGRWASIPGSEASEALRARMSEAVERLAREHVGERIAIVSHGGSINAYIATILGIERDYFFPAVNTSISVVRVKGPTRMVFALNDISHLRETGLFSPDARE
ncbi:MAG: histidine phosphatase family protein [Ktedonobacterales bacterium]